MRKGGRSEGHRRKHRTTIEESVIHKRMIQCTKQDVLKACCKSDERGLKPMVWNGIDSGVEDLPKCQRLENGAADYRLAGENQWEPDEMNP